jgi:hypothetical protein
LSIMMIVTANSCLPIWHFRSCGQSISSGKKWLCKHLFWWVYALNIRQSCCFPAQFFR